MQSKVPVSPARRRDKMVGLLIIVATFGLCMALSLWGMSVSTPTLAPEPGPPTTNHLPGFPKQVDPLSLVERARSLSVRSKFRGFVATGVKPDGTMDFAKRDTTLRYSFQSPQGMGHQPPRQGGTLPTRRYCGLQSIFVRQDGMYANEDQPERHCPRVPPENITVPMDCTLKDVWDVAIERKIKATDTATIEFYDSDEGPAYRFRQSRKEFVLSARDCKEILKGKSMRGSVP